MELLAKIKIDNLYKSKDFEDKKTGVVTPGKWKIQTFDRVDGDQGEQMKLVDISIPDGLVKSLENKVGEVVTISVATYISNNRIGYYGI